MGKIQINLTRDGESPDKIKSNQILTRGIWLKDVKIQFNLILFSDSPLGMTMTQAKSK